MYISLRSTEEKRRYLKVYPEEKRRVYGQQPYDSYQTITIKIQTMKTQSKELFVTFVLYVLMITIFVVLGFGASFFQ